MNSYLINEGGHLKVYLRLAHMNDLPKLKLIYKKIVDHMNENHLQIWDEIYPCEFLGDDIVNDRLYVLVEDKDILGAFALCSSNAGAKYINWEDQQANAFYIDRLVVNIDYLRQGIASLMLNKAMEILKDKNVKYLRLFVVDVNEAAIHLYRKNGFIQMDGIYDEVVDKDFVLHEYGFEMVIKECE